MVSIRVSFFLVAEFARSLVTMLGVSCKLDCPILDTPLRNLADLFPDLTEEELEEWGKNNAENRKIVFTTLCGYLDDSIWILH